MKEDDFSSAIRISLIACAFAALLGGCVADSEVDGAPTVETYEPMLLRAGSDTLTIYAEDTTYVRERAFPIHAVIRVGNGTYNGIKAILCNNLSIQSEAMYLGWDCGPQLDAVTDTIMDGYHTSRHCSEKKPADF